MAKFEYHPESAMPGKGPGIVLTDVSPACFDRIRQFVTETYMGAEAYKMKEGVNPFLQGEDRKSGWIFIEFWSSDRNRMNLYAEAIHKIFERHHGKVVRFTPEMFSDENLSRFGRGRILTRAEVEAWDRDYLISYSEVVTDEDRRGAHFYSTKHGFAYTDIKDQRLLPDNFVPCTTTIPYKIAPREGFESGYLDTAADMMRFDTHCNPESPLIESIEELVDHLNKYYVR